MRGACCKAGVVWSLFLIGWLSPSAAQAQLNPNGFIRSDGWNMLFLDQAYGSDLITGIAWPGGGPAFARANWVLPHDIGAEDPKAGDVWGDIAFVAVPNPGPRSWTMTPLSPVTDPPTPPAPTWVDYASLVPLAAAALGAGGVPTPIALPAIGDVVNFQDLTDRIRQFPDPDLAAGVTDNAVAIATTYVRNNTGSSIYVQIGSSSDDGIRVMVNNLEVCVKAVGRGVTGINAFNIATQNPEFEDFGGALLPPGISKITAHVFEGGGGWGLRLGIIRNGVIIKDGNGDLEFLGTGFGNPLIVGQAMPVDAFNFKNVNPFGWILAKGWNFLGPLDMRFGNAGGGPQNMLRNWTYPYDIASEDPKSGDQWDIDFLLAGTQGFAGRDFTSAIGQGELPRWFTYQDLHVIATGLGGGALLPLPGSGEGRTTGNPGIKGTTNTLYGRGDVHVDDMLRFLSRLARVAGLPTIDGKNCGDAANISGDCDPDNHLIIATTYVRNKTGADLPVDVVVGSDDSCQVWVNCQLVDNTSFGRGFGVFGSDIRRAVLPPGISKIALLNFEAGGDSGFRLALRTPGSNFNLADGDPRVEFLGHGSGDNAIVGVDQFCVERLVDEPNFRCSQTATVTIQGNGKGSAGDPVTVIERLSAFDLTEADIANVSHGGTVAETVANDVYVNTSSTGGDIWTGCDSFEFDYAVLNGNFDVSVEFIHRAYSGDESLGSNGKIGLMARESLVNNAQFQSICDHGPDPRDSARTARRRASLPLQANTTAPCGNMLENGGRGESDALRKPRFFRIKRLDQVITTWISNLPGLGDGSLSATDDANWNLSLSENWNAASNSATAPNPLPADLFVGFVNSENGQFFADIQKIVYRILPGSNNAGVPLVAWTASQLIGSDGGGQSGTTQGSFVIDKTITWNVTRGDVNDGLGYDLTYGLPGRVTFPPVRTTTFATNTPRVVDGPPINTRLDSYAINFFPAQSGPVGDFESSHDIGFINDPRTPGSTTHDALTDTYTVKGSGTDIWDNGDRFHFAYKEVAGNFVATVRIAAFQNPPNARWGRAGIMARYTCDHNSKYSFAVAPYRGEAPEVGGTNGTLGNDPKRHQSRRDHLINGNNRERQVVPGGVLTQAFTGWVRLTRLGPVVASHFADDVGGEPGPWVLAGSDYDAQRPEHLLVGLVSGSHSSSGPFGANLLQVTYDNWSVEPVTPAATTCTGSETIVPADFDFPLDPFVAAVASNNAAFVPMTAGGRLQLTPETNSFATAVWFATDGFNLGDTGFTAEFDLYASKAADGNPPDGVVFTAVEATFADMNGTGTVPPTPPVFGLDGGRLGYKRGDHNDLLPAQVEVGRIRRKSVGVEIDTWDGGLGDNDPLQKGVGPGFNSVYHVGVNVNNETQSSQNNIEYGVRTLPPFYSAPGSIYTATQGIHVEVTYDPSDRITNTSVVEAFITANDGSYARTKVLSTRSAVLTGDAILGFTAGTGGENGKFEVDNFKFVIKCCEMVDTAAIAQQADVDLAAQEVVTLDGSGSTGADAAARYQWTVVSGPAEFDGPANIAMPQLQLTGTGDVTVRLNFGDGVCGNQNTATAEMTFSVSCSDAPEGAEITVPPGPHEVGSTVVLDSAGSTTGTRTWSIVSGPGEIVGPADGNTVEIQGNAAGDVVVGLTVDDGLCRNGASAEATVTFETLVNWKRCNANGDAFIDIADPVFTLNFLFSSGPASACFAALNCNVDALTDIADAVYSLNVQFGGRTAPPFWQTCENFDGCPSTCE